MIDHLDLKPTSDRDISVDFSSFALVLRLKIKSTQKVSQKRSQNHQKNTKNQKKF